MSYHPTLGRFIQRDPLGYVDGGSLYEYVSGDPAGASDPTGLWTGGKRRISDRIRDLEGTLDSLRRQYEQSNVAVRRILQRRIGAVESDLRHLREALNNTGMGHSDFPGGSRFDWNREDDDPKTAPVPVRGTPGSHFQPIELSQSQVDAALKSCDADAFQRAIHRGQDYFSHYRPGYRWDPSARGEFGHIFHVVYVETIIGPIGYISFYPGDVDDARVHADAFEEASAWTQRQLDRWKCQCS